MAKLRQITCAQVKPAENLHLNFDNKILDVLLTHLLELDESLKNKSHKDKRNISSLQLVPRLVIFVIIQKYRLKIPLLNEIKGMLAQVPTSHSHDYKMLVFFLIICRNILFK